MLGHWEVCCLQESTSTCKNDCSLKGVKLKMRRLLNYKKILTFVVTCILTTGVLAVSLKDYDNSSIEAKTIAELQEQKKENQNSIANLEKELKELEANQAEQQAYQKTLQKQIDLMQENLRITEEELTRINGEITATEDNINQLNSDIAVLEQNVSDNTEIFKQRLKAMYITGNDSLATAVLGSTDFYDMISRVEMISKIADHDSDLIEGLKNDIDSLETSKNALETEKLTLEMKQGEQETKKAEFNENLEGYNSAMKKSQEEIERLKYEESLTQQQIAEHEAQFKKADDEINAIIEREERKKREEEEAKKQQQQNSVQTKPPAGSSVTPSYSVSGFSWPVPGHYYISSGYGRRWGRLHAGIDIAGGGIQGASVCASKSGTVIGVSSSCTHNYRKSSNCCGNGYGNYVLVQHPDGTVTMYAHLQSVYVSYGAKVTGGQALGAVGCTGHSTGFHLHFEIRINGSAVNPQKYL